MVTFDIVSLVVLDLAIALIGNENCIAKAVTFIFKRFLNFGVLIAAVALIRLAHYHTLYFT
jgi:hypothetical protein